MNAINIHTVNICDPNHKKKIFCGHVNQLRGKVSRYELDVHSKIITTLTATLPLTLIWLQLIEHCIQTNIEFHTYKFSVLILKRKKKSYSIRSSRRLAYLSKHLS